MSVISDIASGATGGLLGGVGSLVKEIRNAFGSDLTPEQQAVIQAKLADLEIATTNAQMEMVKAEASSADPWTSRARPTFMYVFYAILLVAGVAAPLVGVFFPQHMAIFFTNMGQGFRAIPDSLYALFGTGYVGYVGFRSYEKVKGPTK